MTRHAPRPVSTPPAVGLDVEVRWPAVIAGGELGRSTNALVPDVAAAHTGPSLRRLELVATISLDATTELHGSCAAVLTEGGADDALLGPRTTRTDVARIGRSLHITVHDAGGGDGDTWLTLVLDPQDLDAAGRLDSDGAVEPIEPRLLSSRLAESAGLAAGALGRPTVHVRAQTDPV